VIGKSGHLVIGTSEIGSGLSGDLQSALYSFGLLCAALRSLRTLRFNLLVLILVLVLVSILVLILGLNFDLSWF
jgi:hypothetical protein